MGTIYVKNGNWDEACAKLKVDFDSREAEFNARLGAAFAPAKKQPEAPESKVQPKSSNKFSLASTTNSMSRSRTRG